MRSSGRQRKLRDDEATTTLDRRPRSRRRASLPAQRHSDGSAFSPRPARLRLSQPRKPPHDTRGRFTSLRGNKNRPPTKVAVTNPRGQLVQTVNGVETDLTINASSVPTPESTPKSFIARDASAPQSQDKRVLRSQDGGSRLKSDLSIYFPNYEDVIYGAQAEEGKSAHQKAWSIH